MTLSTFIIPKINNVRMSHTNLVKWNGLVHHWASLWLRDRASERRIRRSAGSISHVDSENSSVPRSLKDFKITRQSSLHLYGIRIWPIPGMIISSTLFFAYFGITTPVALNSLWYEVNCSADDFLGEQIMMKVSEQFKRRCLKVSKRWPGFVDFYA